MRSRILFVVIGVCLATSIILGGMQGIGRRRSVWTGVYTATQAERGKTAYEQSCIRCHAASLDGVQDANLLGDFAPRFTIRGNDFMERWREDTAFSLYTFIKTGMPPRTEPGAKVVDLSEQAALDITAYIFQKNEFPEGKDEMILSDLRNIRIQGRDGAKPLPSFSVVQAVGCLKQLTPGNWELAESPEPIRIRQLSKPSDEDIQDGANEPPGNIEFDLQNIGYIGREFDPSQYEGHKMMVRGILIRQPPNVRIDVREMVEVAQSCDGRHN